MVALLSRNGPGRSVERGGLGSGCPSHEGFVYYYPPAHRRLAGEAFAADSGLESRA